MAQRLDSKKGMESYLNRNRSHCWHSKMFTKTLGGLGLLPMLVLAAVPTLHAGSLDSTVIGMFPKDVGNFGYADLDEARQLPWFPQFEAQLVPVALFGFEQFLQAVQLRQTSPINQVVWASVGAASNDSDHAGSDHPAASDGQLVAVAIGNFDIGTIKSFLDSKSIPSVQTGDYTLYTSGSGFGSSSIFFTLLDSRTIAFGPLEPLKRVLRIRDAEEDNLLQNEAMMTLIDSANGDGIFWGVLNGAGTGRAIERLVPEAAKFPQSSDLIAKLKELLITVKAPGKIDIEFKTASDTSSDAVVISQLLQAGVLLRRYQTNGESNPEMSSLLDALRIAANGNLLDIYLELTNEQLVSLIEHNTFTMYTGR